jgi:hypothetical protein
MQGANSLCAQTEDFSSQAEEFHRLQPCAGMTFADFT